MQAIAERIKELDFHECKVLLTNVDIQSSETNIVLQVIGAMSNRGAPRNKFVQTFILARQPVGFYVLNDMLRFIQDEGDDEDAVEGATDVEDAQKVMVQEDRSSASLKKTLTSSSDLQQQEEDVAEVNRKLEEKSALPPTISATTPTKTNGAGTHEENDDAIEEAPVTVSSHDDGLQPEEAAAALEAEETSSEKPKDPVPSPDISSPPASAETTKSALPAVTKPSGPRTWATLVASTQSKAPAAAAPVAVVTPKGGQSQVRAIPAQAQPVESPESTPETPSGNSGWQTAGNDHGKKHSRPQSMSGDKANVLAYVKYVNEKVDADELNQALAKFGDLAYFDISRQKVSDADRCP